jgi:3-phosphoshikimate 1-carboxyvinyltransferase
MNVARITHPGTKISAAITLPASKSISNRALILNAVSNNIHTLHNLSEADDTVIMQRALAFHTGKIDLKNAGTCMRFLTAYIAATPGSEVTLNCDPRMELRPVSQLVNALRQLGADITYLHKDGFPPLRISGQKLTGATLAIDASVSSQFISAMMMIAPLCKGGLTLELTGRISSRPYIDMTARMMTQFGLDVEVSYPKIRIAALADTILQPLSYTIEPDWSAAGYWYEIAALSTDAEIQLADLHTNSLQGDSIIAQHMEYFGVRTEEAASGIIIRKGDPLPAQEIVHSFNLYHAPDMAPALAVTAAATGIETLLTGLDNLAIKESNRLEGIASELTRCGFGVTAYPAALHIHADEIEKSTQNAPIRTYGDHRMAMAFAPLALLFPGIIIEEPAVVDKSYPRFWNDLQKAGFDLKS